MILWCRTAAVFQINGESSPFFLKQVQDFVNQGSYINISIFVILCFQTSYSIQKYNIYIYIYIHCIYLIPNLLSFAHRNIDSSIDFTQQNDHTWVSWKHVHVIKAMYRQCTHHSNWQKWNFSLKYSKHETKSRLY